MSNISEIAFEEFKNRVSATQNNKQQDKTRKTQRTVGVLCVLEIPEDDLNNMSNKVQEFEEVKRNVEATLRQLNYRTRFLDPTWQGWRLKSFVVDHSTA